MNFKKWLMRDSWDGVSGVGAVPTGPEPGTAGGYAQAGLSSGGGHGGGAFDYFGQELKLPQKKKRRPPLGKMDGRPKFPTPPPLNNIELVNNSQNSGGSGSFA